MRCTKCGYVSFDHLAGCPRCSKDTRRVREALNLLGLYAPAERSWDEFEQMVSTSEPVRGEEAETGEDMEGMPLPPIPSLEAEGAAGETGPTAEETPRTAPHRTHAPAGLADENAAAEEEPADEVEEGGAFVGARVRGRDVEEEEEEPGRPEARDGGGAGMVFYLDERAAEGGGGPDDELPGGPAPEADAEDGEMRREAARAPGEESFAGTPEEDEEPGFRGLGEEGDVLAALDAGDEADSLEAVAGAGTGAEEPLDDYEALPPLEDEETREVEAEGEFELSQEDLDALLSEFQTGLVDEAAGQEAPPERGEDERAGRSGLGGDDDIVLDDEMRALLKDLEG